MSVNKYNTLLYDSNTYDPLLIDNFGAHQRQWRLMSDRSKELMMLKITCNVLLCNMEPIDQIDDILKKRKLPFEMKKHEKQKKKAKKEEKETQTTETPSSSKKSSEIGTQQSTSSSSISLEECEEDPYLIDPSKFRFRMIKYMDNEEGIVNHYTKLWKIERTEEKWDIVDARLEKFVKVEIGSDLEKAIQKYERSSTTPTANSSLILIDPQNCKIHFHEHPGDFRSIPKVMAFLLQRKMVIDNLGIIETEIQHSKDLTSDIFLSKYFNSAMIEWIDDWNKESFVNWSEKELYGEAFEPPSTIRAKELYEKLTHLKEKERTQTIKWRGKISPEGWVHNIEGNWETDKEMVEIIIKMIKEILSDDYECYPVKDFKFQGELVDVFSNIIEKWEESQHNTFLLYRPSRSLTTKALNEMLGVGKRKRIYNPEGKDMKQKENCSIQPLKYHTYFEEIIRRLNRIEVARKDVYVYPNLFEEAKTDDHPLAIISEHCTTSLLKHLLRSNTAIWSSKHTNIFSRIGGAYSGGSRQHNIMRSSVCIFPICANLAVIEGQEEQLKLLSGIVVRGPNHAKSPTDRIPLVSIEIFKNNKENNFLISNMNNGIVLSNKDWILLARSNSIMKEDTAYMTFTENSLFNPLNMLGLMTLENPNIPPNCNVMEMANTIIKDSYKWFLERFTEGILTAAIGNARDEGYIACLRKIIMVLYSWKNNNACANWDIDSFCTKTNENLLDNPISMHLHLNVLEAIKQYANITEELQQLDEDD